ncbi:MAG: GIY-YIG nuclease family protein [Desulfovibrionaceae bacterium]|nr:GIY-YIG nuclease family protein [Desulfovibrionaceae bacterium]
MSDTPWYVYMVQCRDGSLYTGIAKNLEKRVEEHNSGSTGAKYTRSRRPVHLVYQEEVPSRSAAAKREYEIKQLTAAGKNALIHK